MSQRRANWVGLRTLRQLPKAVGQTDDGEPIYEIRSVQLLLPGTSAHFVRLTECSRCMRGLGGAPVLSATDLDRPPRPMICADCVRSAGVSTVWEYEDAAAGDPLIQAAPAVGQAERRPVAAEAPPPTRRDVLEGHLRAVTDRVNELGRIARLQQTDAKERAEREEATAAALREELAELRALTEDSRAEMQRLAAGQADLERWRAQGPPAEEAGAGELGEEVARLGRLLEDQRADLAAVIASLIATQEAHGQLAHACQILEGRLAEAVAQTAAGASRLDSTVEALITDRVGDAEGRLAEAGGPVDLSAVEELVASRVAEAEHRLAETQARPATDHVDLSSVEELIASRIADAEDRLAETLAPAADQVDLPTVEKLVASRIAEAEGRLPPAPEVLDLSTVDELVVTRLDEAEGRLAQEIVGQWGDLETAIEASVAASMVGLARAQEKLAGGQGVLEERVEELAGQVARAFGRLESLLDRLDSVEGALRRAAHERPVAIPTAAPPAKAAAGNLLDNLDRQLEAAARRLAARSEAGAGRGEP